MGIFRLLLILVDKVDQTGNLDALLLVQAPRRLEECNHLLWRHILTLQMEGPRDHFGLSGFLLEKREQRLLYLAL